MHVHSHRFVDLRKVNPYCCECSLSRSSDNYYRCASNVDRHDPRHDHHAGSAVGYELRVVKSLENTCMHKTFPPSY